MIPQLNYIKNWIDPLLPFFTHKNYKIIIYSVQKLNSHQKVNGDIDTNKYVIYDISYWSARQLIISIKNINADAAIFFHFKSFFDFIMLRITKNAGIKSIYVQHGLYYSTVFSFVSGNLKSSVVRYFFLIIKYFQYLLYTNSITDELSLAYKFFNSNDLTRSKFDHAILYSYNSLKFIQNKFRFNKEEVVYSGYPVFHYSNEITLNSKNTKPFGGGRNILFIQERFIPGHTHISNKQELEYFSKIKSKCDLAGCNLTFRLHPRIDHKKYKENLSQLGINVSNEVNLSHQIDSFDIIVGHLSTTLYAAVLLKKPIVTLFYPGFVPKIKVYKNIALEANDFDSFFEILENPTRWNKNISLYDDYIESNIGINNSYEHLSECILNIINSTLVNT